MPFNLGRSNDVRILVVDDEAPLRRALRRTLERAGYSVVEASDVAQARRVLEDEPVALVFCDVNMPGESGLELVRSAVATDDEIVVIMLTGVDDPAVATEALAVGAHGYLVKPIAPNEALINVVSGLRRRELELERKAYVRELEAKILTRTSALRDVLQRLERTEATARHAERDTVDRLVTALSLRSEETGAHIRRVGRYSQLLARRSGINSWSEEQIRLAAMLHDVGKIGIPDAILLKAGPLTDDEFTIIKRHPALGSSLLAEGESPLLRLAAEIALTHHERWDGRGYPHGLGGDTIPVFGRIAAIADAFDAMTSDRVYRPAVPLGEALSEIRAERGRQFDPDLVDVFASSLDELGSIREDHPDVPAAAPPDRSLTT
jgi:putative two-component system response regulator